MVSTYHKPVALCYTWAMSGLEAVERCDLCGGSELTLRVRWRDNILGGDERWNVMRCARCGLNQVSPRPGTTSIGRYYPDDKGYVPYQTQPKPVEVSALQRRIGGREAAPPGWLLRRVIRMRQDYAWFHIPSWQGDGKLLDIGCATGTFLDVMKALGWETHGVELNPTAAAAAEAKGHQIKVGPADVEHHPPASFDVIYLWHALEHTHSPARTLAAIKRQLKPGGSLVMAVPNFNALQRRIWGESWPASEVPRHLYHFTRPTLRRYLEDAGFGSISMRTRTGAVVAARGLRYACNRIFKTRWQRDPGLLTGLMEAPTMVSNLFGFGGLGSEIRVTCRNPA